MDPQCLKFFTDIQLLELIEIETNKKYKPNFPIHSQSVERAVHLSTEVSVKAASVTKRNELAFARVKTRTLRPTFLTKRDWFKCNL